MSYMSIFGKSNYQSWNKVFNKIIIICPKCKTMAPAPVWSRTLSFPLHNVYCSCPPIWWRTISLGLGHQHAMQSRRNRGAGGLLKFWQIRQPFSNQGVDHTHHIKGVSDLKTCMDYFALPGRIRENLNFATH